MVKNKQSARVILTSALQKKGILPQKKNIQIDFTNTRPLSLGNNIKLVRTVAVLSLPKSIMKPTLLQYNTNSHSLFC